MLLIFSGLLSTLLTGCQGQQTSPPAASNGSLQAKLTGAPKLPEQALTDFKNYQAQQAKIGIEQMAEHAGAKGTATLSNGHTVSVPNAKVNPVKN
jgi:hypothetical protein